MGKQYQLCVKSQYDQLFGFDRTTIPLRGFGYRVGVEKDLVVKHRYDMFTDIIADGFAFRLESIPAKQQ